MLLYVRKFIVYTHIQTRDYDNNKKRKKNRRETDVIGGD